MAKTVTSIGGRIVHTVEVFALSCKCLVTIIHNVKVFLQFAIYPGTTRHERDVASNLST